MIIRLAHVEVGVADLDRARDFYVGLLGFAETVRTDQALYLRASHEYDLWSLKLTAADGPGMLSAGFRVSEPEDLARLKRVHAEAGLEHADLPAGLEPGRGEGLRVRAPSGHVIDFHHEIDELLPPDTGRGPLPPMRTPATAPGVPPTVLDHINTRVTDVDEALDYWTGTLGFSPSELVLGDDGHHRAGWVRCTRHNHDVACGAYAYAGLHHFAYCVADGQAMLRTCDLLADGGFAGLLQMGPARHGASNALTMYFLDPDGNRIELFCGDYERDLDRPANTWPQEVFDANGRWWWGVEAQPEFLVPTPLLQAPWPGSVEFAA